jgi:hypothetical protein
MHVENRPRRDLGPMALPDLVRERCEDLQRRLDADVSKKMAELDR